MKRIELVEYIEHNDMGRHIKKAETYKEKLSALGKARLWAFGAAKLSKVYYGDSAQVYLCQDERGYFLSYPQGYAEELRCYD